MTSGWTELGPEREPRAGGISAPLVGEHRLAHPAVRTLEQAVTVPRRAHGPHANGEP